MIDEQTPQVDSAQQQDEQHRAVFLSLAQKIKRGFIALLVDEARGQNIPLFYDEGEYAQKLTDELFVLQAIETIEFNASSPRENIMISGLRHAYALVNEVNPEERAAIKKDGFKALEHFSYKAQTELVERAHAANVLVGKQMEQRFALLSQESFSNEFKKRLLNRFMHEIHAAAQAVGTLAQQEQAILASMEQRSQEAEKPFPGMDDARELIHKSFVVYGFLTDGYEREFEKWYGPIKRR